MLNIDATYGHTAALGHLAREFAPSRMYGLKGANGSGKSKFLPLYLFFDPGRRFAGFTLMQSGVVVVGLAKNTEP
ncbi:hypothetical protein ACL1BM_08415 [Corynebacterium striatum]